MSPFDRLALIGCGATTGLGAAMNTAKVDLEVLWQSLAVVESALTAYKEQY
ncbi:MAG: hypothetical protein CM1200mP15_04190 [Dehalococcoidia bacterium]|nr:MAG: hypothetical protein CM1200mP15_04190 [Dehalococcoidia bacterium]